jgi:hypothetical protein
MGKIIGLSGYARSGKDEFFKITSKLFPEMKVLRLGFADGLKSYLNDFLIKETGFSAFTMDEQEKKIIRPYLVSIANYYRFKTGGKFWIDNWEKERKKMSNDYDLLFVTDVRFVNELVFLKNEKKSLNISISLLENGKQTQPANISEANDTSATKSLCDLSFTWDKSEDEDYKTEMVSKFYDSNQRIFLR